MCTISLREPNLSDAYTNQTPYIDVAVRRISNRYQNIENDYLTVRGILDTAASRTLVCQSIIDIIGVQPTGGRPVVIGVSGKRINVREYFLEVELYRKVYQLRVAEWKRTRNTRREPYILVGRDILNNDSIMFDGVQMIGNDLSYHVWRDII